MYNNDEELITEKRIFLALKIELDQLFATLNGLDKIETLESKKVGVYKHLKKLLPCFDVLFQISEYSSLQSQFTQQRMIIDNYAILYLLTSFSSKEEQELRYYLYLLDSTTSRPKMLKQFLDNCQYGTEKNTSLPDKAIEADHLATSQLIRLIEQKSLDKLVNEKIIKEANWKFVNPKSFKGKNKYSWEDLYIISKIKPNIAHIFQHFHSSFVHGLALSLHSQSNDDHSSTIYYKMIFASSNIIKGHIIKILLNEYPDETKNIRLHEKTLEFLKEIEK